MKVVLFGAGGPVAEAAIASLEMRHALRLCDIRPPDELHPARRDDPDGSRARWWPRSEEHTSELQSH